MGYLAQIAASVGSGVGATAEGSGDWGCIGSRGGRLDESPTGPQATASTPNTITLNTTSKRTHTRDFRRRETTRKAGGELVAAHSIPRPQRSVKRQNSEILNVPGIEASAGAVCGFAG